MRTAPENWNGVVEERETETVERVTPTGEEYVVNGSTRLKERTGDHRVSGLRNGLVFQPEKGTTLALFCFEDPASPVGQQVGQLASRLADRGVMVHVFTRRAYEFFHAGVFVHALGDSSEGGYLQQVQEFSRRAANAFQRQFPVSTNNVFACGFEWSTLPLLSQLHGSRNVRTLVSLQSFERQRSDLSSEESRQINEIEIAGLREMPTILIHEDKVEELARTMLPDCAGRVVRARWQFPAEAFRTPGLDQGAVKARYKIGPVDPTVLYVGDFDDRHGPDALIKSLPPILRNNKQVRFVFVGDGPLFWPVRVHARYLLLEQSVCFAGHVSGKDLCELVQGADIIAVPSREQTEWWPILAGWAAGRPVVTTQAMKPALDLRHEQDSLVVYPDPNSLVWGIERLLFDADLMGRMREEGRKQLDERFGLAALANQLLELAGALQPK